MAYVFTADFESGATSPYGFDSILSSSMFSIDTVNKLHGTGCLAVASTGAAAARLRLNAGTPPSSGTLYYRFYFKQTSNPSATSYIFKRAGAGGSANLLQVAINTSNSVTIRDHNGTSQGGSYTITNGTWYRFEVEHNMTAGTMRLRIWASSESTGTPDFDSGAQTTTGTADLLTLGQDSTTCISAHLIDQFQINDAGWIGPVVTTTVSGTGAQVYIWNGAGWVSA